MDLDPSVVWDFAGTLVGTLRERPRQLPATVSRVDPDGTVWLSMPGADGLVPASTTADVRADDAVTVEWWGNAYHVTGNGTSPSVGTRAASALRRATAAAAKVAGEAKGIADAVGQHFWADGNGVHVSNEDGNATGERNILMNSLGILLRQGSAWLASFSDSAVAFYDGLGNAAENIVAQFGADGARIGKSGAAHSVIDANGQRFYGGAGGTTQLANIGYGEGTNVSSTTNAPYFTFGTRKTNAAYPYSSSQTYNIGDHVMYNSVEYVCCQNITTAEEWNALHWKRVIGIYSTAIGRQNTASDADSVAIGYNNTAIGSQSFALGIDTMTTSSVAFAFGNGTKARHFYTIAAGYKTTANSPSQVVIGKYNVPDNTDTYALVIGNGTADDARSNAFAVGWDGTVTHDGDVPWTTLPLTSSVTAFSDGQVPMYRKWGPVVTLCGAIKMTSAQSSNFSVQIGQLPVGCRPKRDLQILCQGSNEDVWLLVVNAAGEVRAGRYRHGASYTAVTTSTWFPFTATFLVA